MDPVEPVISKLGPINIFLFEGLNITNIAKLGPCNALGAISALTILTEKCKKRRYFLTEKRKVFIIGRTIRIFRRVAIPIEKLSHTKLKVAKPNDESIVISKSYYNDQSTGPGFAQIIE